MNRVTVKEDEDGGLVIPLPDRIADNLSLSVGSEIWLAPAGRNLILRQPYNDVSDIVREDSGAVAEDGSIAA